MNNAFCYSRNKEDSLFASLPRRIAGQCLVVMQRLLFDAAHTAGCYCGEPLERGEVALSVDAIRAKTSLSIKSIRNALATLEKCHELGKQRASQGANRPNVYVIVNYEDWDELSQKGQAICEEKGKQRASQPEKGQAIFIGEIEEKGKPLKEVKEVKEKELPMGEAVAHPPTVREKLEQVCIDYPEVPRILHDQWIAHTPLPASAQTPKAKLRIADTIRLLHTADNYDWPQIAQIVEHAATVWQPQGMIGSPASLRDWTSKHDRKIHEAILAQINSHPPAPVREPDFLDKLMGDA